MHVIFKARVRLFFPLSSPSPSFLSFYIFLPSKQIATTTSEVSNLYFPLKKQSRTCHMWQVLLYRYLEAPTVQLHLSRSTGPHVPKRSTSLSLVSGPTSLSLQKVSSKVSVKRYPTNLFLRHSLRHHIVPISMDLKLADPRSLYGPGDIPSSSTKIRLTPLLLFQIL